MAKSPRSINPITKCQTGNNFSSYISDDEKFTYKSVGKNCIKTLCKKMTENQRENYHARKSDC